MKKLLMSAFIVAVSATSFTQQVYNLKDKGIPVEIELDKNLVLKKISESSSDIYFYKNKKNWFKINYKAIKYKVDALKAKANMKKYGTSSTDFATYEIVLENDYGMIIKNMYTKSKTVSFSVHYYKNVKDKLVKVLGTVNTKNDAEKIFNSAKAIKILK